MSTTSTWNCECVLRDHSLYDVYSIVYTPHTHTHTSHTHTPLTHTHTPSPHTQHSTLNRAVLVEYNYKQYYMQVFVSIAAKVWWMLRYIHRSLPNTAWKRCLLPQWKLTNDRNGICIYFLVFLVTCARTRTPVTVTV